MSHNTEAPEASQRIGFGAVAPACSDVVPEAKTADAAAYDSDYP